MSEFVYNEDEILEKAKEYIGKTYGAHYAGRNKKNLQFWDLEDAEEAKVFFRLNAKKYIHRFGRKKGHNPDDLLKAIHYICMLWHFTFEQENVAEEKKPDLATIDFSKIRVAAPPLGIPPDLSKINAQPYDPYIRIWNGVDYLAGSFGAAETKTEE
jgi:hypothetical protein